MRGDRGASVQIRAASPLRSLGSMLRPYRGRIAAAAFFHLLKDSPLWLIPCSRR